MTSPTISPGLPVKVGEIEQQLGRLWEQSDAGKARASLVNLVIYSEAEDAIAANTPLLSTIAADHAFRALLVEGNPKAEKSSVEAWITAHCHLRETGQKEICSEQVTFRLDGSAAGQLPSIVFSHLDSDLPLYLWWQGALQQDPQEQLWTRVDRLIIDSSCWSQPASQFKLLEEIGVLARGRCAVCDLTWTRLFHLRYAAAQIFDISAARKRLTQLENIVIHHSKGHWVTALVFLGWMASRLGWKLDLRADQEPILRRPDGGAAHFKLVEDAATKNCLTSVAFHFGDAKATVHRQGDEEFYLIDFTSPETPPFSQMLPAGREKSADTLLSELSRGSRHPLFWPAIKAIQPLLHDI